MNDLSGLTPGIGTSDRCSCADGVSESRARTDADAVLPQRKVWQHWVILCTKPVQR